MNVTVLSNESLKYMQKGSSLSVEIGANASAIVWDYNNNLAPVSQWIGSAHTLYAAIFLWGTSSKLIAVNTQVNDNKLHLELFNLSGQQVVLTDVTLGLFYV